MFRFLPDLIKGDLDSLRDDVREYYSSEVRKCEYLYLHLALTLNGLYQGVPVVHDRDQDSTDLMKCIYALQDKEKAEGVQV